MASEEPGAESLGAGRKVRSEGAEGASGGLMLSVAAVPEQWLGKFMRLCVIIIKQVSRGTAG